MKFKARKRFTMSLYFTLKYQVSIYLITVFLEMIENLIKL